MNSISFKKQKKYAKISTQVRRKLIQRVVKQGKTIASSAKYFRVKASTAKAIVRKYRQTGEIFIKKSQESEEFEEFEESFSENSVGIQISEPQKLQQVKIEQNQVDKYSIQPTNLPIIAEPKFQITPSQIIEAWAFHFMMTVNYQQTWGLNCLF